jgi:hypothetical protein
MKLRVAAIPNAIEVIFATGTTVQTAIEPGICLYIHGYDRPSPGSLVLRVVGEDKTNLYNAIITEGVNVCDNKWHDIKIVNDNEHGIISIAIDNTHTYSAMYTPNTYPTYYGRNFVLGCMHAQNANTYQQFFTGDLDDIEIWQGTSDEITVGEYLDRVEDGWKRYDDSHSAITYGGGNWFVGSATQSEKMYNKTYHGTAAYGQTNASKENMFFTFRFKGTKLRWIGYMSSATSDSVKVEIDGIEEIISIRGYDAIGRYQTVLYEKNDLPDGEHLVKITANTVSQMIVDAIDIDENGRLLHLDEVLSVNGLTVGKRIRCGYKVVSPGALGSFYGLGQENKDFIPATSSVAPDGDFYFICVDFDRENGRLKLLADRNLQHTISYDALNTAGVASGSGLLANHLFVDDSNSNLYLRLPTGGINNADKDNEWDRYVEGSDLEGSIIPGDVYVWNQNNLYSITSTSPTSTDTSTDTRVVRGYNNRSDQPSLAKWSSTASSYSGALTGFRPILIIEKTPIRKFLVEDNGKIKRYSLLPGSSLKFNGNGQVLCSTSPITGSGDFTIIAMIKTSSSGKRQEIIDFGAEQKNQSLFFYLTPEGFVRFDLYAVGGTNSTIAVNDGKWHQVAVVHNGGMIQVFVDGLPSGNSTIMSPSLVRGNTIIGAHLISDQYKFNGNIDDISIWSRALTKEEITYYRNIYLKGDENGIVHYWTFDEATGSTTTEKITQATGTLTNVQWSSDVSFAYRWETVGDAPATEEMFNLKGMSRLLSIDETAIQLLSSNHPKILMWTDDQESTSDMIALEAIPNDQVIMPIGDIDIPGQGINDFTLTATAPGTSKILAFVSKDSGQTWQAKVGSEFVHVNLNDLDKVRSFGMTPNVLNAITQEEWNTYLGSSKTIRFAYYLEQNTLADVPSVSLIGYTPKGAATSTPSLESITITYEAITLEGRLQDLERINAINIAKLNFKSNALLNSEKYKLHDMVVDTFEDDSMIRVEGSLYRPSTKDYQGPGIIETDMESLPDNRSVLIVNADHHGCKFEYSLDGGITWYNINIEELKDITNQQGNELKIRVTLPDDQSTLTALSYAWA